MFKPFLLVSLGLFCYAVFPATAQTAPAAPIAQYDAELAKSLGADERGMRSYVMVILKTGPNKVPNGPARDAIKVTSRTSRAWRNEKNAGAGRSV